jgi:hypothetical protein
MGHPHVSRDKTHTHEMANTPMFVRREAALPASSLSCFLATATAATYPSNSLAPATIREKPRMATSLNNGIHVS